LVFCEGGGSIGERKVDKKAFELRNLVEQYYDIQQNRVQAFNRVVSWIRDNLNWQAVVREQAKRALWPNYDPFDLPIAEDYQKTLEAIEEKYGVVIPLLKNPYAWYAERLIRGKGHIKDIENMVWCASEMLKLEERIEKRIAELVQDFQIYTDYLSKIRGIGHVLAAGLIGWIAPISRFEYASRLRAYAGLTAEHYRLKCEDGHKIIATSPRETCPIKIKKGSKMRECDARIVSIEKVPHPPKRVQGYYTMINLKLKTHFWRVAKCFEYQKPRKSYYRYLYDRIKHYYTVKWDGKLSKGHIRMRSMLWTVSLFASHLWEVWRRLEGLPVTEPYPIAKLGHTKFIAMTDEESPLCPKWVCSPRQEKHIAEGFAKARGALQ